MPTRLEQTHPRLAAWLAALPPEEQQATARRLARAAADRAGLVLPSRGTELSTWADELDGRGWVQHRDGTWEQATDDFLRARAASAVRDADADAPDATADSVYEAVTALGEDAVRAFLRFDD